MIDLTEFSNSLAHMPAGPLIAFVMLAGFGLAAYAIYAVLSVLKGKQ